jgi:hypothetical protein
VTIEAQNLLSNVYRWSAYVGACSDIAGESSNRRGRLLSPADDSSILPRGVDLIVSPRIYNVTDPNSNQYGSGRTKGSARPRTDISHQIAGAHGGGEEEGDGDVRMREEWERRGGNVRRQDGCSAPCNETVFSVCSSAGFCTCASGSEDVGGGSCVSTSNLYIEQIRVNGLNLIFRCLLHLLDRGPGVSNQFRSDGGDSRFCSLLRVSGFGFRVSAWLDISVWYVSESNRIDWEKCHDGAVEFPNFRGVEQVHHSKGLFDEISTDASLPRQTIFSGSRGT